MQRFFFVQAMQAKSQMHQILSVIKSPVGLNLSHFYFKQTPVGMPAVPVWHIASQVQPLQRAYTGTGQTDAGAGQDHLPFLPCNAGKGGGAGLEKHCGIPRWRRRARKGNAMSSNICCPVRKTG
jgi:hypothetical protein